MGDFSDITGGLRVATMLPQDAKRWFLDTNSLKDLGTNSNKAFTYYDGMLVYTVLEGKSYRWRKPKINELGLLDTHFQYPANTIVGNVNYSNKEYNFFLVEYGKKPIPYLTLELIAKGQDNILDTLQIGDIVEGFKDETTYWKAAVYNGGDVNGRGIESYTPIVEVILGGDPGELPPTSGGSGSGSSFVFKENWDPQVQYAPDEIVLYNGSLYLCFQQTQVGGQTFPPDNQPTFWKLFLPKGVDGSDGADGENGADGQSAYEIAVANGYSGTVNQWLASLIGAEGKSAYELALEDGYVGTLTQWLLSLKGAAGANASNNLQKEISENYVLTDADNNYTILVKNNVTPVTITVPNSTLRQKFNVGFILRGTADVTFVGASGVTINNPIGLKGKGQGYALYLERDNATQEYNLMGNTKA